MRKLTPKKNLYTPLCPYLSKTAPALTFSHAVMDQIRMELKG